jgi:hypothetical protein
MKADRNISESREIDWSNAASFSIVGMDRIMSIKDLIKGIVHGAEKILDGWTMMKS